MTPIELWAKEVNRAVMLNHPDGTPKTDYEANANPLDAPVEKFINERPGYVAALRASTETGSDYWRWQGHAEARRQLAQALGWTVPHEPGDSTDRNEQ